MTGEPELFSPEDLSELSRRGISPGQVEEQLRRLRRPARALPLLRACTVGDGLVQIPEHQHDGLLLLWEKAANDGRFSKFVPASGAATRMFSGLLWLLRETNIVRLEEVESHPGADVARLESLRDFAAQWRQLPFAADLPPAETQLGTEPDLRTLADAVLGESGLNLAAQPKGLLPFHRDGQGARSAFQEQLTEAVGYLTAPDYRQCSVHFTVSPQHRPAFDRALEEARDSWEEQLAASLVVSFSTQSPSTDFVASDPEGRPVRQHDGSLLFRPSGHGALLPNLQQTDGDLVYVKNIDNVLPAPRQELVVHWKRLLGGLAVDLQAQTERWANRLGEGDDHALRGAGEFLSRWYGRSAPAGVLAGERADLLRWTLDAMHRPLRICGMVPNAGHPGGGPFWVRGTDGTPSTQIVESAQVDRTPEQQSIWRQSTHFNPVDLVCALRDRNGGPYDLERFVDQTTAFVAERTFEGREITTLERPGLWNGAMAGWNTVFVEVPAETFAPVKTLLDLAREPHYSEGVS